ncbi:MAG: hypothetical protein KYX69_02820 [Sphingomonas sp.]|uniref:hypothetical protein n=1 Tax=Sphingomonas sp. TaxID=28214 RepID=UPI002610176E|nr:hypothetical protein [Sphingomonas sp.]MDK2766632.1 hypothetical protein [Sphingomonas sp.]
MSVFITLTIMIAAWEGCTVIARLTVDLIATAMGIVLTLRAARIRRRIIAMRSGAQATILDFDRRPSRAQRRSMAAGLKLAIRQTELRSLFPATMERSERIAALHRGG